MPQRVPPNLWKYPRCETRSPKQSPFFNVPKKLWKKANIIFPLNTCANHQSFCINSHFVGKKTKRQILKMFFLLQKFQHFSLSCGDEGKRTIELTKFCRLTFFSQKKLLLCVLDRCLDSQQAWIPQGGSLAKLLPPHWNVEILLQEKIPKMPVSNSILYALHSHK